MPHNNADRPNMLYFMVVLLLTFVLPAASFVIEKAATDSIPFSFALFGKWFIFYAVGFRLFLAGIKQITNPSFTAREIFHINGTESFPILHELGFANLCFGLVGIASLLLPQWRIVSAFGSGLYYGLAGINHFIKKPAGVNEKFALVTDMLIFALLMLYVVVMF